MNKFKFFNIKIIFTMLMIKLQLNFRIFPLILNTRVLCAPFPLNNFSYQLLHWNSACLNHFQFFEDFPFRVGAFSNYFLQFWYSRNLSNWVMWHSTNLVLEKQCIYRVSHITNSFKCLPLITTVVWNQNNIKNKVWQSYYSYIDFKIK